jgi:hypothetical protein
MELQGALMTAPFKVALTTACFWADALFHSESISKVPGYHGTRPALLCDTRFKRKKHVKPTMSLALSPEMLRAAVAAAFGLA